jgi:hypothetical protein
MWLVAGRGEASAATALGTEAEAEAGVGKTYDFAKSLHLLEMAFHQLCKRNCNEYDGRLMTGGVFRGRGSDGAKASCKSKWPTVLRQTRSGSREDGTSFAKAGESGVRGDAVRCDAMRDGRVGRQRRRRRSGRESAPDPEPNQGRGRKVRRREGGQGCPRDATAGGYSKERNGTANPEPARLNSRGYSVSKLTVSTGRASKSKMVGG